MLYTSACGYMLEYICVFVLVHTILYIIMNPKKEERWTNNTIIAIKAKNTYTYKSFSLFFFSFSVSLRLHFYVILSANGSKLINNTIQDDSLQFTQTHTYKFRIENKKTNILLKVKVFIVIQDERSSSSTLYAMQPNWWHKAKIPA